METIVMYLLIMSITKLLISHALYLGSRKVCASLLLLVFTGATPDTTVAQCCYYIENLENIVRDWREVKAEL